jgi:hypothetical protein
VSPSVWWGKSFGNEPPSREWQVLSEKDATVPSELGESIPADRALLGPSPTLPRRTIWSLIALSCVVALVMTWPLVLHLGNEMPAAEPPTGLLDPMYQAWEVAWEGHALIHQPLHFYDTNIFWPAHASLAFSDAGPGFAPAGLLGSGPTAATVRYDLLFLLSYVLAFVGAGLLSRELGVGTTGSLVAAAAFAYAPWRLAQRGHLNVLSTGGIPLAVFLLVRGWRRRRPGLILLGWLVAAWQLSLGFATGLLFAYLLAVVALVAVVSWFVRGCQPRLGRSVVMASGLGLGLFVALGVILAVPYYRVARTSPEIKAELKGGETVFFSPPPFAFLVASQESIVWGGATQSHRAQVHSPEEESLFPGMTVILLAAAGLVVSSYPRRLRLTLAVALVVTAILSLGFGLLHGALGFRFVWEHAPGWRSLRTPGRLATFTSLSLALLAGLGAHFLASQLRRRQLRPRWEAGLAVVLLGAVLLEGAGHAVYATPPTDPGSLAQIPGPQLHLPTNRDGDVLYQFWSVDGFPELVNGYSRFTPCFLSSLRRAVRSFPSHASVTLLEQIGVASVVIHSDLTAGTPWAHAADQSIGDLGILEQRLGTLLVYELPVRSSPLPVAGPGGAFPHCTEIG